MTTFVDAILASCAEKPDRERITFLGDSVQTVCGRDLNRQVLDLSAALQSVTQPMDKVLLAHPASIDFVVGFLASLHAGLVPVPVTYPKPRRPLSRYSAIANDCGATLALTTAAMLEVIDPGTLSGVRWHSHETLSEVTRTSTIGDQDRSGRQNDELLFLQYTSGSTSKPKGVCVTSKNVLSNLRTIRRGFGIDQLPLERRVVCSWLPAYHDMGLVGIILSSLAYDGHAVLMSPIAFVQQPLKWIRALSDYRAAVTVAPCFGYHWSAAKISKQELTDHKIDLSGLSVAACGAEPIEWSQLQRFAEHFAGTGFRREAFYPCYGLAESTLMVTGADRGGDATPLGPVVQHISRRALKRGQMEAASGNGSNDSLAVVSCGTWGADTRLFIVDPTSERPLPDGHVGEIRVQSPSVAVGYWNHPEDTESSFGGRVVGQNGAFLCTGDLGFVHDHQLYITGRIKDLIIIGGQNHYPQDIEKTVLEIDPILARGCGVVFSVPREANGGDASTSSLAMGERLVLAQELPREFDIDQAESLVQSIRVVIARTHELTIEEIVLIRPAALSRTSSGKIQRSRCRERFLAGDFSPVFRWQSNGELDRNIFPDLSGLIHAAGARSRLQRKIQNAMLQWLSQNLNLDERGTLRPDCAFAETGVNSLMAVELSEQLQRWLGVPLSPVAAWSHPTPEAMATYLADRTLAAYVEPTDDEADTNPGEEGLARLLEEIEAMDESEVQSLLSKRS